jgi:Zn-dependent peptidase ImmA (M78 family)
MASVPAIIKPELLKWGRTTSGYALEKAADKLKVAPDKLDAWERGVTYPTVPQLRNMAALYKRPLAAFYLPAPPQETLSTHDFRLKPDVGVSQAPELLQALRIAHGRRDIALELYEQIYDELPAKVAIRASLKDDFETTAAKLRDCLDVTLADQRSWPEAEAFARWRAAVERINVLVFQVSRVPTGVMRGFSIAKEPYPVMVLNSADAQKGRIFSIMHELTHIALRKEGVCDFHDSQKIDKDVEVFCNRVAGAILVPKAALVKEPEFKGTVDADGVESVARRYRVSREVVLRRLLICEKIKKPFYDKLSALYKQQYEELQEAQKDKEGGPKYSVRAFNAAGPLFSRLVLENYHQDKITASDVSDYLSVKMSYLSEIEKLAWK